MRSWDICERIRSPRCSRFLHSICYMSSVDAFLTRSYLFDFPGPVDKFRQSLSLPSTHTDSPHPALRVAMCLVACRLSKHSLTHLEPYFLSQAMELLDESLSMVDRLLDFIIATTLVSRYCFYVGHDIRGAYMASCECAGPFKKSCISPRLDSAAMTFAVSCGLHSLSPQLGDDGPWSAGAHLMPPPESIEALRRRIRAWWSVFLVGATIVKSEIPDAQ